MTELYQEILVWKRQDDGSAIRFLCFKDLATGKFAVQSADFFHVPADAERFRHFERQAVELFIETSPRERCVWFDSLEGAIEAHLEDFSWATGDLGRH